MLHQPSKHGRNGVDYNGQAMWVRFRILTRSHVFILACLCACVIAFPIALASIPADGTSWYRFLGPSRQFDPWIDFGSAFVSIVPLFVGYYHLGRTGAMVGAAAAMLLYMATQVVGTLVFGIEVFGKEVVVKQVAYLGGCSLLTLSVLWVHFKASNSRTVRETQHSLGLD
jgi:hypothetical protein